jgi:hypothetical protein
MSQYPKENNIIYSPTLAVRHHKNGIHQQHAGDIYRHVTCYKILPRPLSGGRSGVVSDLSRPADVRRTYPGHSPDPSTDTEHKTGQSSDGRYHRVNATLQTPLYPALTSTVHLHLTTPCVLRPDSPCLTQVQFYVQPPSTRDVETYGLQGSSG